MRRLAMIIMLFVLLAAGEGGTAEQSPPQAGVGGEKAPSVAPLPPSGLVSVYNRPIVVFHASFFGHSPQERARATEGRINKLIKLGTAGKVSSRPTSEGTLILLDGQVVFMISPQDIDPIAGEGVEAVVAQVVKNLTLALDEVREGGSLRDLLRAAGLAALFTGIFVFFLWGLLRAYRGVWKRLEGFERRRLGKVHIEGLTLLEIDQILFLSRLATKLVFWAVALLAAYAWLAFDLRQFPFTRPWGENLKEFLVTTAKTLALGIAEALPGIFVIVVIFFLTRFVVRLVKASFSPIEKGSLKTRWVDQDTAVPTRRILVILIWLFAVVVMYPYIPGSSSDAFKGIGIFVGLVASLGSTALVGQAASGLVLTYSRAFRPGDYVKIGETEGTVLSLGLLATKIRTIKEEEVTIPNAGLIGATLKNYSRMAECEGVILYTSVTIGYNTPWRQVHEMLTMAADRTAGLKKEPRPFVLQTALSDFYVEYQINAYLEEPQKRIPTLASLHANIQDAFNEYGVQIMSPHYMFDPAEKVWVPKEKWFEPPAKSAETLKAAGLHRAIPRMEKERGE
jgi:small-conductance mechanosensitive channel